MDEAGSMEPAELVAVVVTVVAHDGLAIQVVLGGNEDDPK